MRKARPCTRSRSTTSAISGDRGGFFFGSRYLLNQEKQELKQTMSTGSQEIKKPQGYRGFDGRGDKIRTRDLRFWRPSLFQLSYTPR